MLEVTDLQAAYGRITALRGISLTVAQGEIVTVIGANGAGKSTLLRSICGMMRPAAGSIRLDDQSVGGLASSDMIRRGVVMVPEGRHVFADMTVAENLDLGAYYRRDRAGVRADTERVLTLFPILRERFRSAAGRMSGGQQQMLAIARALMSHPRLLLLDEPSLGLSPILVQQIFGIIRRINREQNVSILLVEQNAHMALQTADFGYVLEVGRIVAADHCKTLMRRPDIQEFYLGQKEAGARGTRRWKKKRLWN
jgi:branched-chain amino acid transport system ATP-binding protein